MGLPDVSAPDLSAEQIARAGLRTFFRIAALWDLSVEEQMRLLGGPARSTYFKWKKEGAESLPHDVLERISYVLGIYKALQVLLPDEAAADAWVRRPNDAAPFGGRSALKRMLSGNVADLYEVRRYLDAERGGWP
ncbi:MAG: antitoxin Xre/MbcA/ParS toxin-binding domain-containing protein [Longimicrobiales bacterium]